MVSCKAQLRAAIIRNYKTGVALPLLKSASSTFNQLSDNLVKIFKVYLHLSLVFQLSVVQHRPMVFLKLGKGVIGQIAQPTEVFLLSRHCLFIIQSLLCKVFRSSQSVAVKKKKKHMKIILLLQAIIPHVVRLCIMDNTYERVIYKHTF